MYFAITFLFRYHYYGVKFVVGAIEMAWMEPQRSQMWTTDAG